MENDIMVSVICTTYNHGEYIKAALDGFLMQELPYAYEVLIHDDASTDETVGILKQYEEKHPEIFRIFYEEENQFKYGKRSYNQEMIMASRGKYVAVCEGDDYWTDPQKLSKQVAVLQAHPEYAGCCHNQIVVQRDGTPWPADKQRLFRQQKDTVLDYTALDDICKFSHTASMLMRRELFTSMPEEQKREYEQIRVNSDMLWAALMSVNGGVYYIAEDMACYRFVPSGTESWSARMAGKNINLITYQALEKIQAFIMKYYHVEILYKKFKETLFRQSVSYFMKKPTKENYTILRTLAKKQKKNVFQIAGIAGSRVIKKCLKSKA